MLVGGIARALAVFGVAEVVVYQDDQQTEQPAPNQPPSYNDPETPSPSHDLEFMCRNLEYMETPPYLKKLLFPMHPHLKFAGMAPALECVHHFRKEEWSRFREGCVMEDGLSVEVGLRKPAVLSSPLEPYTRITFEFDKGVTKESEKYTGKAVSPLKPIEETRKFISWGYTVRAATCVEEALKGQDGYDYDLRVGVKDRNALALRKVVSKLQGEMMTDKKNILLVFPGISGLPTGLDIEVNFAEWSQSRTVRCEELLWMTLSGMRPLVLNWIRKE